MSGRHNKSLPKINNKLLNNFKKKILQLIKINLIKISLLKIMSKIKKMFSLIKCNKMLKNLKNFKVNNLSIRNLTEKINKKNSKTRMKIMQQFKYQRKNKRTVI
jgi:hypothetical protein